MNELKTLKDVSQYKPNKERLLYSANHDEIISGATTDIYFIKTQEILKHIDKEDVVVTAEIFPRSSGIVCGIQEVINILKEKDIELWALEEGESFERKDTIVRIKGAYSEFGIFETALLGCLASSSGWATATKECREACGELPFICFGSRHIHPSVAPVMERAAIIGGANNASNILAAKLCGLEPSGTVPHSAFLIAGDTLKIAKAYDECMPKKDSRIVLVDTFKDEVEETLRVAELLKDKLAGIRLDTPSERGGVTSGLVQEVRARLDLAGYNHVKIFVSGGLTPERIKSLIAAGASAFGVGSYISGASAIEMTMDLKEVDGESVAKRGRIPGLINNPKLKKIK